MKYDLSNFFEHSLDLLTIARFDGHFEVLSPSWTHVLGYSLEELRKRTFYEFIHPEDLENTRTVAEELIKIGRLTNFTNRYIKKDGTFCWIMWSAWTHDNLFWAAGRDVTQLRQLEIEKESSRQLLYQAAHNLPGSIYRFTLFPNGHVLYLQLSEKNRNDLFATQEPYSFEQLGSVIHPDDLSSLRDCIQKSAADLNDFIWTGRVIKADGQYRWIEARSTPEMQRDGAINWNGITYDITENVQRQRELEAAQAEAQHAAKMAALGKMAAGIAHEVNNPLAIVHGYADRILRFSNENKLTDHEAQRLAQKILNATDRMEKSIRSLTALAYRTKETVFEQHLLSDVIEDALNISAETLDANGIQFSLENRAGSLVIDCEPTEISQTLINLLNNSCDAVRDRNKKWIKIIIEDLNSSVRISVCDSGPGIPADVKEQMWQPFSTTKPRGRGTGLGLPISKRLIERHSGKIHHVETSPYTRFDIELPKKQEPAGNEIGN